MTTVNIYPFADNTYDIGAGTSAFKSSYFNDHIYVQSFNSGGDNYTRSAIYMAPSEQLNIVGDIGAGSPTTHVDIRLAPGGTGVFYVPNDAYSFTDVTTGDVSTSAHGFTPKLPNDNTKFLDGTGAYTVPAGTGVPTSRSISTTSPISGGGDLSANRTFSIAAATSSVNGYLSSTDWSTFNNKVGTARNINTTAPITGGGDLSADRTIAISDFVASGASHARGAVPDPGSSAGTTKFLREDATFAVPPGTGVATSRNINTTAPVTGGGDLSADRMIAVSDFVASGASHARGTVPDPGSSAGTTKFLREDATWVAPSSGADSSLAYVTIGNTSSLSAERSLTGTANQITVTDGGANSTVTLALPQNYDTAATPQLARLGLGAAADASHALLISQGTITADKHAIDISATWNNAVTTTGIKLNVTETSSGSSSLLMDLQKDNVSKFKVAKGGAITSAGEVQSGTGVRAASGSYIYWNGVGGFITGNNGYTRLEENATTGQVTFHLGPLNQSTVPTTVFICASGSAASNANGTHLELYGGAATGTGAPGLVKIATSFTSTSGGTTNALTTPVAVGGTLKVDTTTTGNVGAGEDTLITYTIPASQLGANGFYLEFDVWGSFAANANTKELKVYFGSTVIGDSTAAVFNGIAWRAHGKVVRKSSTTQTATCEMTVGGTLLGATTTTITQTTAPTETLTSTVVFKCTGADTGVTPVDNSIVQEAMVLKTSPGQ